MNTINFSQSNFPLTTTVLGIMQDAVQMIERISYLFGSYIIIAGCEEVGNTVSPGYVIVDGAPMYFEGGTKGTYVKVQTTVSEIPVGEGSYMKTQKSLVFGTGTGQILWSEFESIYDQSYVSAAINDFEAMPKILLSGRSEALSLSGGETQTLVVDFGKDVADADNYNAMITVRTGNSASPVEAFKAMVIKKYAAELHVMITNTSEFSETVYVEYILVENPV